MPTSRQFFKSRVAKVLEAYLIVGDVISERSQIAQAELREKSKFDTDEGQSARTLIEMIQGVGGSWGRTFSIIDVAKKIDLSARIGE